MKGDVSEVRNLLLRIILLIILIGVVLYFLPQILALMGRAEEQISPPTEETQEDLGETQGRSLDIISSDPPEIIMYKLFRNFDPSFFNEKNDPKIMYYPFILDLKGIEFDEGSGDLIDMLKEGIKNFSDYDNFYQIGADGPANGTCGGPIPTGTINCNNDCWTSSLDTDLNNMGGAIPPCEIKVNGDVSNKFNDKVKIRVGWLLDSATSPLTARQIIYTLITICDG